MSLVQLAAVWGLLQIPFGILASCGRGDFLDWLRRLRKINTLVGCIALFFIGMKLLHDNWYYLGAL